MQTLDNVISMTFANDELEVIHGLVPTTSTFSLTGGQKIQLEQYVENSLQKTRLKIDAGEIANADTDYLLTLSTDDLEILVLDWQDGGGVPVKVLRIIGNTDITDTVAQPEHDVGATKTPVSISISGGVCAVRKAKTGVTLP